MRAAGFGRVINVGTNLFQNPVVPYHDYTAAKAALLSMTRTLSHDLGPDGITVNMVSGGLLRTTDASAATPEAVFDLIAASTPLRRVTTSPSRRFGRTTRSEEHTSELQSLMRISYAVFCLTKKIKQHTTIRHSS